MKDGDDEDVGEVDVKRVKESLGGLRDILMILENRFLRQRNSRNKCRRGPLYILPASDHFGLMMEITI